jgi:hypothetical protein
VQSGKLKEQTPLLKGHESEVETWRVTMLWAAAARGRRAETKIAPPLLCVDTPPDQQTRLRHRTANAAGVHATDHRLCTRHGEHGL